MAIEAWVPLCTPVACKVVISSTVGLGNNLENAGGILSINLTKPSSVV